MNADSSLHDLGLKNKQDKKRPKHRISGGERGILYNKVELENLDSFVFYIIFPHPISLLLTHKYDIENFEFGVKRPRS